MKPFILIGSVTLLALAGCSGVEKNSIQNEALSPVEIPSESPQRWWLAFDDPLMNEFADVLLAQNFDIKIAATRVAEARAIARGTNARLFPELALQAGSTRGNTLPGTENPITISRGGFEALWEVDLFGGTRADAEAASARAVAAGEKLNDARNSVIANLMRAIVEWRRATQTLQTVEALLSAQDEQVHLFSVRADAGLIDTTFVMRARAEREQTATQVPQATAMKLAAQYQIELLLGEPAENLAEKLKNAPQTTLAVPDPNAVLNLSIETIRQRPDIRAAEFELDASRSDLASAKANLWPKLTLSGFFGAQDVSGRLLVADNPLWSAGASLSAPLFNFGRLRAAVDSADSRTQRAQAVYENTILIALQETQTALAEYLNGLRTVEQQSTALNYREKTISIASERFRLGINDMTDLTTAQAELNRATMLMIEAKANTAISYIKLQKSLATTITANNRSPH